jgi:hypothetical protein
MQKISYLLFATVLLFTFQSCSKKTIPTLPSAPKTLDIEQIEFGYLHGKARLSYQTEKGVTEAKASIRIRKDSVIWIAFSQVGIVGRKALINKDSITILDNQNKEYETWGYEELSSIVNFKIDYSMLEAAVLGNPIKSGNSENEIGREGESDKMVQKEGLISIKTLINPITKKVESLEVTEATTNNSLKSEYSNFQPLGNKYFPYNEIIKVFYKSASGTLNNFTITIEYNKAEVGDKELKFPFNIPKRYVRR